MNKEKISEIIGQIDEKYVEEANRLLAADENDAEAIKRKKTERNTNRRLKKRIAALAAGLLIFAAAGIIAFTISAEAREYQKAAAFFEENGLSMQDLTRTEVKEVYKDITTKSFSYDKTADVIRQAVSGLEILQEEPTPEELAAIWDFNILGNTLPGNGIKLVCDDIYEYDEDLGADRLKKSVLKLYQDGKLIWTAEFPESYVGYYEFTKEGTVVSGARERYVFEEAVNMSVIRNDPWIAVVDDGGKIRWQSPLEHGTDRSIMENVASVMRNDDGTWAVISQVDLKELCLSTFDDQGNELDSRKTEIGKHYGVWDAARLGDGYILQIGAHYPEYTSKLCKMDRDGNLQESFSYEAEGLDYYFTDMVEFGGQVFLSGYSAVKQKNKNRNHELADVLDYVFEKKDWDISGEELTPMVRDNYEAVLLLCDPEGGSPRTFYSVKGSLGGKLNVNEDQLEWDVESINGTFFSPATDSFTIGGSCKVFRYTFSSTGAMTEQKDTGETVPFRR